MANALIEHDGFVTVVKNPPNFSKQIAPNKLNLSRHKLTDINEYRGRPNRSV